MNQHAMYSWSLPSKTTHCNRYTGISLTNTILNRNLQSYQNRVGPVRGDLSLRQWWPVMDYYTLLSVERSSSPEDIKAAYRWRPEDDRMTASSSAGNSPSNGTRTRTQSARRRPPGSSRKYPWRIRWLLVPDLLLPYLQVLSDAAKRRVYDKQGKRGLETKGQGQEKEEDPFDIFRKFYGFYG